MSSNKRVVEPEPRPSPAPGGSMNPMKLLMIQLLPLLVFIVIDSFVDDVRISIGCAVLFAIGQLAFTWVATRRFEWLILVDVGLIAGLGAVSIALDNDLFFKVKPAIVEALVIVLFVVLLVAPSRFLLRYVGRMMPGRVLRPEAVGAMKVMLTVICAATALHIGAVLYTAFQSSREVWAFVSGPGFYLFVLPAGAGVVLVMRARRPKRPG